VIVADTNLLVYFYVRGQRTPQAEAVLARDAAWVAPVLWRSEFRSALMSLIRSRTLVLDDALRIAEEAERHMRGAEYAVASTRVLPLAAQSGCSAYDCEFVALAQDLQVPFVTTDRRVLAAFPTTAIAPEAFLG
jgi:predicted nucleic acid-binding protein